MAAQTLRAKGQIGFSLIKNALNIRAVSLSGETMFLYDTSENVVGSDMATITATL
jgi:hypothetical protein